MTTRCEQNEQEETRLAEQLDLMKKELDRARAPASDRPTKRARLEDTAVDSDEWPRQVQELSHFLLTHAPVVEPRTSITRWRAGLDMFKAARRAQNGMENLYEFLREADPLSWYCLHRVVESTCRYVESRIGVEGAADECVWHGRHSCLQIRRQVDESGQSVRVRAPPGYE